MYEFLKSLALVAVPVIIGSVSTYWLTHSWQDYRFKIKIKQDVISVYNESIEKNHRLQWSLVRELFVRYSGSETFDLQNGKIQSIVTFPTDPKEQPAQVFTDEYNSYKKELTNILQKVNFLIANLKLYSDDNSLLNEVDNISSHLSKSSTSVRNLMKSTTGDEFSKNLTEADIKLNENQKIINAFMNKLVKVKIKKIPV